MNGLSWLLYFAEVSTNIAGTLGLIGTLAAVAWVMCNVLLICIPDRETSDSFKTRMPKFTRVTGVIFVFSMLGLLFPSQNTVYLIIASESAEMVVTSPNGIKMMGDIQEIVSLKLDEIADDFKPRESNNSN